MSEAFTVSRQSVAGDDPSPLVVLSWSVPAGLTFEVQTGADLLESCLKITPPDTEPKAAEAPAWAASFAAGSDRPTAAPAAA